MFGILSLIDSYPNHYVYTSFFPHLIVILKVDKECYGNFLILFSGLSLTAQELTMIHH